MNYPIWDLPASGLLIAAVAIVHVFISHFAVGGGLFLVVTERKARREGDAALLGFVKGHTRFFVLLTLVSGAMTGVGIWFTIGLVHPQATAALINLFVWGWAIEWTFFVVEIAAAMVYYYGWDRMAPATHEAVGWIYFWAAWLSLVVINGILTFMLTPGGWLETGSFWQGILNPTYLPAVVARTAASMGLAGLYALFTAARIGDPELKAKIGRYAIGRWIAPMAIVLPISLLLVLRAAAGAGVPVAEMIGARDGSFAAVMDLILRGSALGHPIAQRALRVAVAASVVGLVLAAFIYSRRHRYGRPLAAALMLCGFVALGAGEWVREDLRKPYVIGQYMFVNGVRLPSRAAPADPFSVDAIQKVGVFATARWARVPAAGADPDATLVAEGHEVFRLLCSTCHTVDGYLAIRPLVRGATPGAIAAMLPKLSEPVGGDWSAPHLRLTTWRGRRMPPFVGSNEERDALAAYLAVVGGAPVAGIAAAHESREAGARLFEEQCSMCHGRESEWPFDAKGRTPEFFDDLITRLPSVNEIMPPFEGTDADRRALAAHLSTLTPPAKKEGTR